jgi:hypothetical protein
MSLKDKFESLHPDIISDFLNTGQSEAISPELQSYILIIDKIPALHRKYPSVTTCARMMMKLYPKDNLSFHTARAYIYDAINYFHLNSTVRNEAWNNLYADKADEMHNICVKAGDLKTAKEYLALAKEWRHNPNEDIIDTSKLKPVVHVLSPEVTWKMLGGKREYSLKEIAGERNRIYKDACKQIDLYPINSEQKEKLKEEARLSMNITDAEVTDEQ